MADQNLLIKMILDANNYDKGMANAQKSVQGFIQQNMTLGGILGQAGKALGAFGAAVGVAGGALEAAKKTIASTQTLTDSFERSMKAATAAVDSLFYSIATGSFDNFLNGLKDTIKYAEIAADTLDDLATFQIFASPNNAELKQQREDLKAQIRTGYRYSVDDSGNVTRTKLTDAEIAQAKEDLKRVEADYIKLIQETQKKEMQAYKDVANDLLKRKSFAGGEEELNGYVNYYLQNYANYTEAQNRLKELQGQIEAGTTTNRYWDTTGNHTRMRTETVLSPEAQAIKNGSEYRNLMAITNIGDQDLQALMQHRVAAAMAGATLSSEIRSDAEVLNAGQKGGTGSTWKPKYGIGPEEDKNKRLSEQQVYLLSQEDDIGIEEEPLLDLTEEVIPNMQKAWDKWTEDLQKKGENVKEIIGGVGGAFDELGDVVGGTTGDNIKAIGKFIDAAQGMVPVIESVIAMKKSEEIQSKANSTANLGETATGAGKAVANIPYVGPALAIAAISSILSMASAIKAIKFAEGGVVPGNNYTDGIQAKVSAGEVVLNSHDAKNLYDQIHSGRFGGGSAAGYVSGENIYIGVNNYLSRTGKGQLVVR